MNVEIITKITKTILRTSNSGAKGTSSLSETEIQSSSSISSSSSGSSSEETIVKESYYDEDGKVIAVEYTYYVTYSTDTLQNVIYGVYTELEAAEQIAECIKSGEINPTILNYEAEVKSQIDAEKAEMDEELTKSKYKAILTAKIGVQNHSLAYFDRISARFDDKFDDSVTVLTIPIADNDLIEIELINTDEYTEEEVNRLINSANNLISAFTNR